MDLFSRKKKTEEKKEEIKKVTLTDIHSMIDNKKVPVKESQEEAQEEDINKEADPKKNKVDIIYEEKISTLNATRAILYLTVLGILGIIFFTQYTAPTPAFLLLVWLFGTMCFLPLGLVLGWLFLNPDVRVLVWRRLRGKNYGLVHFVHRGGHRMGTRIKNFDEDVIIQDTKMWILQNDGIYYLDKDRKKILHAKIETQHIKTLPANIPVLYLDPDTMIPLTFHKQLSKSNPQLVGSTMLGYVYNQIAKILYLKKGLQIFFIIIIVLTILNLVIGIQLAMWMDEVEKAVPKIRDQITRLGEILLNYNITLPNSTIPISPYPLPEDLPGG